MNNNSIRPFHLAFPVFDIEDTKKWYVNILGCIIGRESREWVDFNFYGHQIVAHLSNKKNYNLTNEVDNKNVPIRHFGIILTLSQWKALTKKLKKLNVNFLIHPYKRFENKKGEQYTFFIKDPSGNALEFKAFKNNDMIFES